MSDRVLSHAEVLELLERIRDALNGPNGLVIQTSGTLGPAKQVRLSPSALRASATATLDVLGGPGQWLVALAPTVVAGAQMLVRSLLADTLPVVVAGQFEPEAFVRAAEQLTAERRYTSLVPVQLARLLDYCDEHPESWEILQRFDSILIGGQALPHELRERALSAGLRIVRTYGGSETAGGCVYDGIPIGDTRVRIAEGEVLIAGSCLAEGYDNDPQLTRERFTLQPDPNGKGDGVRWFHTRDAGVFEHDESGQQRLRVTGRLDRVLVSGGVKVSLDALEAVIRECPGWQSAVIVAVPDEIWGERPIVVLEQPVRARAAAPNRSAVDDPAESFEQVRAAVELSLGRVAVPDRVVEVERIPLLASGKPNLRALVDML